MTSPANLSTGVTYNRSSIQHWLDTAAHPHLVRLLLPLRPASSLACPCRLPPLSSDDALALANSLIFASSDLEPSSLLKLARFAAESDDNCIFLAKINGFVEPLLNLMIHANDDEPEERNLKFSMYPKLGFAELLLNLKIGVGVGGGVTDEEEEEDQVRGRKRENLQKREKVEKEKREMVGVLS
ncbi:hypothetical protein CRG98_037390 [Punica granatum]|uniref:U-box domain-containing protein n=1 Tax=Punica granatum TaxID=22663 RepID=A0A2I0IEW8_PUNGR|nr:hypothetical protein CRG98_037390 [Punica granatum]